MALLLVIVVWTIYSPGLNRMFATDPIWYFAELDGDTSLAAGLRHYDYAASRRYWKGDEGLFHPLWFVWLAALDSVLTYHHVWWNLPGLGLHVLVGVALYQCLLTIRPSIFALAATMLFAVSKGSLELVLWSNDPNGGQLLASMFLLIAVSAFIRIHRGSCAASTRVKAVYVLALTAAVLCHEAAVPTALLGGILLLWSERARAQSPATTRALAYLLPVLMYVVLYGGHLLRVERWSYVYEHTEGIFSLRSLAQVIPDTVWAIVRWMAQAAIPVALNVGAEPYVRLIPDFAYSPRAPLHLLNLALVIAMLLILVRLVRREHVMRALPLVTLVAGAILFYAAIICFGRALIGTKQTYHLYFFQLFAIVLVYALIDFGRITRGVGMSAGVVAAALIVLFAHDTRAASLAVNRANRDASRYFERIEAFVDAHRSEANFTFSTVNPPDDLDPFIVLREGYPDQPAASVSQRRMTEVLFRRYYDPAAAVHVLDGRELVRP